MVTDLDLKRPSAFLPAAGWVPWAGRTQIRLTGADRAKFLHNFCTNDIKALTPGQGCEAFLTNIKGRILGHFYAFAGTSDVVVDTVPGQDEFIRSHLDRYLITEDVQIENITTPVGSLYVFGRNTATVLTGLTGLDLIEPPGSSPMQWGSNELAIRRMTQTAVPGFEVILSDSAAAPLPQWIERLGSVGCIPVSPDDFNAYRIDAGFPIYGVDLTDDHLAQEAARTERAISFKKGCYLGQEPIARIDALGHVNRELRVVAFESGDGLQAPVKVSDATTGNDVGTLTSIGRVSGSVTVGLGVLRTSAKLGTKIVAEGSQGSVAGEVVAAAG